MSKKYDLYVIDDAAQYLSKDNKKIGYNHNIFFSSKTILLMEQLIYLRSLAVHGQGIDIDNIQIGMNRLEI